MSPQSHVNLCANSRGQCESALVDMISWHDAIPFKYLAHADERQRNLRVQLRVTIFDSSSSSWLHTF